MSKKKTKSEKPTETETAETKGEVVETPAPVPEVKEPKIQEVEFRENLKIPLTPSEVMAEAERMSRLRREIAAKENEASSLSKRFKSEIESLENQSDVCSDLINDKFRYDYVRCIRELNYDTGIVTEKRTDTGAVINQRSLKDEERQIFLKLEEDKAKKEDGATEQPASYDAMSETAVATPTPELPQPTEDMVNKAIEAIKDLGRATTAAISRRLRIKPNEAHRIMETLEVRGIVGPAKGDEPREVLMKLEPEEVPDQPVGDLSAGELE